VVRAAASKGEGKGSRFDAVRVPPLRAASRRTRPPHVRRTLHAATSQCLPTSTSS